MKIMAEMMEMITTIPLSIMLPELFSLSRTILSGFISWIFILCVLVTPLATSDYVYWLQHTSILVGIVREGEINMVG